LRTAIDEAVFQSLRCGYKQFKSFHCIYATVPNRALILDGVLLPGTVKIEVTFKTTSSLLSSSYYSINVQYINIDQT